MLADMWFLHMGPIDNVQVPTPYFGHIGGNRNEPHVWWQSEAILVPQGTDSTRVGPHSVGLIRPPGRVEAACWAANSHLREQEYDHHAQLWLFGGLGAHDYEQNANIFAGNTYETLYARRGEIGIMSDLWVYHAQRIEVASIPEESIDWTVAIGLLVDESTSIINGSWERIGVIGDHPGVTPEVRTQSSFGFSFGLVSGTLLGLPLAISVAQANFANHVSFCRWEQGSSQGWAGCQAQCCCGRPRGQQMAACGCLAACRASSLSTGSRARATALSFFSAISKR